MKQDGFTLIEVLAALAIFSIAIIGLSGANTQSIKTTDRVTDKTYAGFVADNQLVLARLRIPCLLYTSPSPRDGLLSRMPSSA